MKNKYSTSQGFFKRPNQQLIKDTEAMSPQEQLQNIRKKIGSCKSIDLHTKPKSKYQGLAKDQKIDKYLQQETDP